MNQNHRLPGIVAVFVMALTVATAGCGPRTAGEQARGSGQATPGGKTVVRLAFFPNVTHGVALVGTGSGAFQKALGLEATIEESVFTAGPAEIEALFANAVDIGYVGPGPALNGFLKSKGEALRIIAGASSGGAGLVVRNGANITKLADLAGKRVSVPQTGGTQDISLRHALREAGLVSAEKQGGTVSVLQNAPADALTLFKAGRLDAAWVPEPWVTRLVAEGNGTLLLDERDRWPGRRFATTVVIARKQFLDQHPDLVKRFLAAHAQTVASIHKDPEAARRVIGERIKTLSKKAIPEAILKQALGRTDFTDDPLRESVLTFADWSRDLGYQRQGRDALADLIDVGPLNAVLAERKEPAIR